LLKPRTPSIAIFLTASEKGIATSETQKPTQQLHTVYPQDTGKLASRTGFDGCHPSYQLEFFALGEDCQYTHIYMSYIIHMSQTWEVLSRDCVALCLSHVMVWRCMYVVCSSEIFYAEWHALEAVTVAEWFTWMCGFQPVCTPCLGC
jgi:hypothetical protein